MQPRRAHHRRRAPGLLRSMAQRIRRLLARRLRFVRTGLNIHVVLDRGPHAPATTAPDPARRVPQVGNGADPVAAELRQIGIELRQRLGRHALSRTVFDKLFDVPHKIQVHEAGESDFLRAQREFGK